MPRCGGHALHITPERIEMLRRTFVSLIGIPSLSAAAPPESIYCIAPAKPGGGFDLTCRLLQDTFAARIGGADAQVDIRYMPGGIGALAFDLAVRRQWADPRTLIAFSTGSLVNIAQGKFGPHRLQDVRWLATLGTEYGAIAVRKDSPLSSLSALTNLLAHNPSAAVFGAGGTVGSQDWIKAALLVQAAGADHRDMRFVAFEGGGQALSALRGGHVDVFCGDMLEAVQALPLGGIRLLAVLAPHRMQGALSEVPTAREQAIDLVWPTVRGFYMGPRVPQREFDEWTHLLRRVLHRPEFLRLLQRYGLEPKPLVSPELEPYLQSQLSRLREIARGLHLPVT
jgi:putative tricarboxylic transport membrane protein